MGQLIFVFQFQSSCFQRKRRSDFSFVLNLFKNHPLKTWRTLTVIRLIFYWSVFNWLLAFDFKYTRILLITVVSLLDLLIGRIFQVLWNFIFDFKSLFYNCKGNLFIKAFSRRVFLVLNFITIFDMWKFVKAGFRKWTLYYHGIYFLLTWMKTKKN